MERDTGKIDIKVIKEMIEDNIEDLTDINDINKSIKINWTNFLVNTWDFYSYTENKFEVSSEMYLKFAKEDFKLNNTRGLINSLSNAKRAIDNQIESILYSLGYIEGDKNHINKEFIKKYYDEEEEIGITDNIKLLVILELCPSFLIPKIRNLRNQVEHDYIIPTRKSVKEAIEVAEMFINSSNNKIYNTNSSLAMGSKFIENVYENGSTYLNLNEEYIYIDHPSDNMLKNYIIITLHKTGTFNGTHSYCCNNEFPTYKIHANTILYSEMLRIFFVGCYSELAVLFQSKTPKSKVEFILQIA